MKKTISIRGLALVFLLTQFAFGAFAQAFWTETFANQATATANWKSGGTNAGTQVWTWTNDPVAGYTDPANPIPAFGSPTVADGYFLFNSDANGQAKPHDVTLTGTGKVADCTGKKNVKLSFYYQYADGAATASAQVGVSTDNGVTFTYHTVLAGIPANSLGEGTLELAIPEADNKPAVIIQFRWIGTWEYHWKVDDLALTGDAAAVPCDQNPLAIICDNMDAYVTTTRLGPQATWWSTWSGTEGGTEDGIVSKEQASSAPNSVKVISTATTGGPQDVVLLLGNKTTGNYELKWKMYVPAGKNGYYNIQNKVPIGTGDWNLDVFFENNGGGHIQIGGGASLATFAYPNGQWFEVKHQIDLDNDLLTLWVNGVFVKKMAFAKNLGAIDFFGTNNVSTFYVDDVEYVNLPPVVYDVDNCSAAVDLTAYMGQAPGIAQTTGLYDNSAATISASDPGDITCWNEHVFNGTTNDFVDNSMWYTFTGDGNKYHIETVPCTATNYIGTAQVDTGDTQIIIYEGSNCSNLTGVAACNDDLYSTGVPDFRAGLDLQTISGQDYLMLIDGFNFQGTVATGEFCIQITQVPSITCADGAVGDITVFNNGFVCDGALLSDYLEIANDTSFVIPNLGPIYGLSWAITTQEVPAGTWPPSMTGAYWGSFNTLPNLYVPGLPNDGATLQQGAVWYLTPVVVAGAVDTVASTAGNFLHELDLSDACYFIGASQQLVLLPALEALSANYDYLPVHTPPGNDGAIDLTVTGGLFDLVMDPAAYQVTWSGPNGFTSTSEDLTDLAPGNYTATISDVTGCVDDVVVTVSVTTPTKDPRSVRTLNVTPNPAHDAVLLNLALTEAADVRVEVVDMLGQTLETINAGKVSNLNRPLDLARYASGTYLIRITAGNDSAVRRIVVQR